jgi:hypothetical protein
MKDMRCGISQQKVCLQSPKHKPMLMRRVYNCINVNVKFMKHIHDYFYAVYIYIYIYIYIRIYCVNVSMYIQYKHKAWDVTTSCIRTALTGKQTDLDGD